MRWKCIVAVLLVKLVVYSQPYSVCSRPCVWETVRLWAEAIPHMLYQCHPLQRVDMSSVFSGNTFRRGKLNNALTTVKLVLGTEGDIYAGGGEHLTRLSFLESQHTPVVRALVLCSYCTHVTFMRGLVWGKVKPVGACVTCSSSQWCGKFPTKHWGEAKRAFDFFLYMPKHLTWFDF